MFTNLQRIPLRSTLLAISLCLLLGNGAVAEQISADKRTGKAFIALIIDDLGNQQLSGERAIALDGPVACAIMPHTAYATYLAETAHAAGKEVMLHLPMQPVEMDRIAGPGEISLDNDREELSEILAGDLRSVPHTAGINNHMGSLITRHPGHMRWLMDELAQRGDLFFIDSFTTPHSVAYAIAQEKGIPTARRHVFIDNDQSIAAIDAAFSRLKQRAIQQGYAIGIGHPYPATLNYLEAVLPTLNAEGIELVSVTQIINTR
jgi:polysaccharide deacetylase 2 family uncharacterized protein YibQ